MIVVFVFLLQLLISYSSSFFITEDNEGEGRFSGNLMRMMWITPIYTTSILQHDNRFTIQDLQEMREFIMNRFYEKTKSNQSLEKTRVDMFYQFEQNEELQYKLCLQNCKSSFSKNCANHCDSIYPFRYKLINILSSEVKKYFSECNQNNFAFPEDHYNKELMFSIWTSIHANGTYHAIHHHEGSAISGVLYINVPDEHVGDLVFHDPRGALPPFGNTIHIKPKVGDLVIFPSYLMHTVEPTMSQQPRISLSFNLVGDWKVLSDVNQAFLLD